MFSEILRSVKAEWNLTVADALHGPEWFLQNKEKILGTRNHSQLMQFFLLRKVLLLLKRIHFTLRSVSKI